MNSKKVVEKEELLQHIGNWQVLWYAIIDTEVNENNEYNFIHLIVELGCYFRIIDDNKVLTLIVNLERFSKMEVIELINKLHIKLTRNWLDIFNNMNKNRLIEINKIWDNQ